MKDLHNNIDIVSVLDPVVVDATATHTDIDLAGFNSAELFIWLGTDAGSGLSDTNKLTFTLYDSNDGTNYAVVETADMLGVTVSSGVILTVDSTDEDNTLYHFGYVGGKRYLQLVVTETGTVSCPMAIGVVKGHPLDAPPL
jgi:hypothetical protein